MKVEVRVRFNTGEIVEDFVVLYKIECWLLIISFGPPSKG